MATVIPASEMRLEPASMLDPSGQVFWWNSGIYRGIRGAHAEFYRRLLGDERLDRLFALGLVRTKIAPMTAEGFDLVLEHRRVPFVSYAMEWTAEMLRDAALMTCDLAAGLMAVGARLQDAHPWNILFDRGRPIFVDWGSVVPQGGNAEWFYLEFRGRFIVPLQLMAAGRPALARLLFLDVTNFPTARDGLRLSAGRLPFACLARWFLANRRLSRLRHAPSQEFFDHLRTAVTAIPLPNSTTEWSAYPGVDTRFTHDQPDEWPERIRNVDAVLRRCRPATVLDIGSNRGWFSELAVRHGAQVIAVDVDEPSLNVVYRRARAANLPMLPTLLDLSRPTPAHGLVQSYPSAHQRLAADLVLCLAVTHHVVFKRGLSFAVIAQQLADYTRKWLLVEFIPADDEYVRRWVTPSHEWYTLDGFQAALRRHFRHTEVMKSDPAPRVLVFCER